MAIMYLWKVLSFVKRHFWERYIFWKCFLLFSSDFLVQKTIITIRKCFFRSFQRFVLFRFVFSSCDSCNSFSSCDSFNSCNWRWTFAPRRAWCLCWSWASSGRSLSSRTSCRRWCPRGARTQPKMYKNN